jgi:hypothetical protein
MRLCGSRPLGSTGMPTDVGSNGNVTCSNLHRHFYFDDKFQFNEFYFDQFYFDDDFEDDDHVDNRFKLRHPDSSNSDS